MITKTYGSSSSDRVYVCTFYPETGLAQCDPECMGYRYSKKEVRECKHTRDLLKLVARGFQGELLEPEGQRATPAPIAVPESDGARQKPMLAQALDDDYKTRDGQIVWSKVERTYGVEGWLMEEKIDGHRLLFRHKAGKVTAWSRPTSARTSKDRQLPTHLVEALKELPEGIYDGELYVPGGTSSDVTKRERQVELRIALFDILEIMTSIVTDLTWVERRAMLELSVGHHANQHDDDDIVVHVLQTVPVSQAAVEAIWSRNGEGAIMKRVGGYYKQGYRSPDWIKLKREATIEMRIVGYEPGEFGPYSKVMVEAADGLDSSVKTKNGDWLKKFAADPASYVGKTMVVRFTERTPPTAKYPQGSLRHPRMDHIKGIGE